MIAPAHPVLHSMSRCFREAGILALGVLIALSGLVHGQHAHRALGGSFHQNLCLPGIEGAQNAPDSPLPNQGLCEDCVLCSPQAAPALAQFGRVAVFTKGLDYAVRSAPSTANALRFARPFATGPPV
jgi:hypothetical protein